MSDCYRLNLGEVNVFTDVCHSVHWRWGISLVTGLFWGVGVPDPRFILGDGYAWSQAPSGGGYAWSHVPSGGGYAWSQVPSGDGYAWSQVPSGVGGYTRYTPSVECTPLIEATLPKWYTP